MTRIELADAGDEVELRALVQSSMLEQPFLLWYRFPAALKPFLDPENGDPFLAALLAPAMRAGEPLTIHAAVSPRLLRAAREIQTIYHFWDGRLSPVPVEAPLRTELTPPRAGPPRAGLFFTLGVDSWYTLLKHEDEGARTGPAVNDLIIVRGFDIPLRGPKAELIGEVFPRTAATARAFRKRLVPVATNIRDLSDGRLAWGRIYHGAAMASIGLALEGLLDPIYFAGDQTYARIYPWGSHALLDPLWSTERLRFRHDGAEATRIEKLRLIGRWPAALDQLRVCWENPDGAYNCGQCEKCVRTLICLQAAGLLGRCPTLPASLDLSLLRRLRLETHRVQTRYIEIVNRLGNSDLDRTIKEILEERIREGMAAAALKGIPRRWW
ncbi:MAG: hypothetical protein RDU83_09555 [bacterium]|nr:hypothetical protein [bacterium]